MYVSISLGSQIPAARFLRLGPIIIKKKIINYKYKFHKFVNVFQNLLMFSFRIFENAIRDRRACVILYHFKVTHYIFNNRHAWYPHKSQKNWFSSLNYHLLNLSIARGLSTAYFQTNIQNLFYYNSSSSCFYIVSVKLSSVRILKWLKWSMYIWS